MNNKNLNSKKKNSKNKLAKKIAKSPKNSNVVKLNTNFNTQNLIHFKKLKAIFIIIVILILALLIRIGILQFVDGNSLKESAYKQQTINQIISPKRGKIYASTGEALAISARVDTITINPQKIVDENKDKDELDTMQAMNKNMTYMMPIMSVMIAFIAPLGLALYWFISNLLMIVERVIINKIMEHKEEEENA